MNSEKLSILETENSTSQTDYRLPHQYTCGVCGFTSLQGFEVCPRCIVSDENFETTEDISGEGKWLMILGSVYGVISLVIVLNSGGNIEFFKKASETDFLSVSHFAALFAFPFILILTGVITLIRKKDNWKGRLMIGGIITLLFFGFDQFLMRFF